MASAEQIAELRRKVSEPDESTYTDVVLSNKIDAAGSDVDAVAVSIWQDKASMYAELVDISEAGSSRKNSQLMTQALRMAEYYTSGGDPTVGPVPGVDIPMTTQIVRPS